LHFSPGFTRYVFWITGGLTVGSGLHYMAYWFRMMGEGSLEDDKISV